MRKNYKPKEIIVAGTKFDIVYKTMKDFGELDFTSDEPVDITLTMAYDFAVLKF